MRAVITPITGPFTNEMKSIIVKRAAMTPHAGRPSGSSQSGIVEVDDPDPGHPQWRDPLDEHHRRDAPDGAPAPPAV